MDPSNTPRRSSASGRSSVVDSLRGFTLSGVRIPKEELQKKITFPEYLRLAMREAIRAKDGGASAVAQFPEAARAEGAEPAEWPMVVFVNSKSGGRHGPELKARLQELMGEEQVESMTAHFVRVRVRVHYTLFGTNVQSYVSIRICVLYPVLVRLYIIYSNCSVFS